MARLVAELAGLDLSRRSVEQLIDAAVGLTYDQLHCGAVFFLLPDPEPGHLRAVAARGQGYPEVLLSQLRLLPPLAERGDEVPRAPERAVVAHRPATYEFLSRHGAKLALEVTATVAVPVLGEARPLGMLLVVETEPDWGFDDATISAINYLVQELTPGLRRHL